MMSVFDRVPINKTAAIVTSQSGCASDGTLSDEQKRENLVLISKELDKKIMTLPKKSKARRLLGLQRQYIDKSINALRPAKKAKGVADFFIDAARDNLSAPHFNILMSHAVKEMERSKL